MADSVIVYAHTLPLEYFMGKYFRSVKSQEWHYLAKHSIK